MDNYQITSYSGAEIEALLVKIDELNAATPEAAGLMSAADKAKLDGVNSGAEVNRINRIMLGETEIAPTEKVVTLPLDTAPVLNGTKLLLSGAVYQALTNYYTKAQVNALISDIKQFSAVVVATLPESGEQFTLYLVGPTGTGADKYEEYIWNNDAWLKIGDTSIDLSGYATKEELSQLGQETTFNFPSSAKKIELSPGYIVCNGSAGTVVDLTPVSHATYKSAVVNCSEGDIFYIQGKGGNSDRLWCFIDSENKVILSATANLNQQTPLKKVAPENAAKLILNDENSGLPSFAGEKEENALLKMIQDGYQLIGIAEPDTTPVTSSDVNGKVFYLAYKPGTYNGFNSYALGEGHIVVFKKDFSTTGSSWNATVVSDIRPYIGSLNVNVLNNKSDAYESMAAAKGAVPSALRQKGLVITYLLSDGWHTEHFIGTSTTQWSYTNTASNIYWEDISHTPGLMVVPFTTDVPTSRQNVPFDLRKNGMIVVVMDGDGVWHIEQNRGSGIGNTSWRANANWVNLLTDSDLADSVVQNDNKPVKGGAVYNAIASAADGETINKSLSLNGGITAGYIGSNNKWSTTSSSETAYNCKLIPIDGSSKHKIKIVANSSKECIYAFLVTDYMMQSAFAAFASGPYGRHSISAGQTAEVDVPSDARYLYLYNFGVSSSAIFLPSSVTEVYSKTQILVDDNNTLEAERKAAIPPVPVVFDADGRDIPANIGVLNMYKKACQMMNIPWTALNDLPAVGDSYTRDTEGQWLGFPYSSVKEYDKFIGFNVSPLTFMTAAHNPYSLLYTEDTFGAVRTGGATPGAGAVGGVSGYGFTYHGINCGPYFGVVCNVFALHPLGFDNIPWNTAEWDYLERMGIFEKIYDQSATGVRLGDVIWEEGHGNLITDIIRDSRGYPTKIYWSESASPAEGRNIVTNEYIPAEFNARIARGSKSTQMPNPGIIYRFKDIFKNIEYEPSPFVAVEGEDTPAAYSYNDDICTFAGDYACFFEGDAIYINYTKGNYTQMEIYKDNVLLSTKNLDSDSSVHKLNLSGDNLGYGKYKARLTDGTNYSDYTYWEIVDCNVTYTDIDGDKKKVEFSSHNGTPLYIQFTYQSGKSRGIYALTKEDIAKGYAEVSPLEILNLQHTIGGNTPAIFAENTYCKVFFKGDYGVVRNNPVLTDLYS